MLAVQVFLVREQQWSVLRTGGCRPLPPPPRGSTTLGMCSDSSPGLMNSQDPEAAGTWHCSDASVSCGCCGKRWQWEQRSRSRTGCP